MIVRKFKELHEAIAVVTKGGIVMKKDNTLVEKWPLRLKLSPEHPDAQNEWDVLQASNHTGSERYVEWKRGD